MWLRTVACVVALTAASAACASDPQAPSTLPSLSSGPSSSATASPNPTPSAITAATPEGAAEFARYFFSQVTKGFHTRDSTAVSRLSLPSCKTCANYVRSIDTVTERGLRVEGGEFDVYLAVAPQQTDPMRARVDVGWNFRRVVYRDASGTVVDEGKAVAGVEEQVDLVRDGQEWRVMGITRIRAES